MLFSFLMETAMPEKIMLMSFLIETAIHDDREARRRRIFCDSCTWSDDFYKGNFILKLMNPKNFPPAAGSHSKIVYLKASPGGITSKNDNQWKNKLIIIIIPDLLFY